jgi:maleylpyruvate isomerase
MSELTLYTYFRSSAAHRVRIALALKGLAYQARYIHLLKDGGEQFQDAYRQINPQALVPTLLLGSQVLTQSLAIIEYLDECHPQPPLLPGSAELRATIRAIAQAIACDIHPLQNLRVRDYLRVDLACTAEQIAAWCRHWIQTGLLAIEQRLQTLDTTGSFLFGERPTLADVCLIPQIDSAQRYQCDLGRVPLLMDVYRQCLALPAFQRAAPENQADAHDT